MNKKALFIAISSLLVAGSAQAARNGWYGGVDIGASSFQDKISITNAGNATYGVQGGVLGLFGGYDLAFTNCFNLGMEAFLNGFNNKIKVTNDAGNTLESKLRYNWGVRVLPGYNITPERVVYLLAGYVNGNFRLTDNGNYSVASNSYNSGGYQLGIGGASSISRNLVLRGDIISSSYANKSFNGSSNINYKNQLSSLEGEIALVYKFC